MSDTDNQNQTNGQQVVDSHPIANTLKFLVEAPFKAIPQGAHAVANTAVLGAKVVGGSARVGFKAGRDVGHGFGYALTHNPFDSVKGFIGYGGHLVSKGISDTSDGVHYMVHHSFGQDIKGFGDYLGSGMASESKQQRDAANEKKVTEGQDDRDTLAMKGVDKVGNALVGGMKALTDASGALAGNTDNTTNPNQLTNSNGRWVGATVNKTAGDTTQVQSQNQKNLQPSSQSNKQATSQAEA